MPSSFNFVSKILILDYLASYRGIAGTCRTFSGKRGATSASSKTAGFAEACRIKKKPARYSHEVKTSGLAGAGKGINWMSYSFMTTELR